jgi:putative copper export protein
MSWTALLRVVHVVLAVFWAGTMFFFVLFLEPSLRALGSGASPVLQALQRNRFVDTMLTVGALTLVSGFVVFWQTTDGLSREWLDSPYGHAVLFGATTGLSALAVGFFVSRPTMAILGKLSRKAQEGAGPPDPNVAAELKRLSNRLRAAGRSAAALLLLSVLAMASSRGL